MECYNLDGVKTELKKDIATFEAYLEGWRKVTFPTRKNGGPFKRDEWNVKGATLYTSAYSGKPELKVNAGGYNCTVGYVSDICYPEDFEQEYLKKAVADRIATLEQKIKDFKKDLENCDKVYDDFLADFGYAMEKLKISCNGSYMEQYIRDTVTKRFPYC